MESVNDTKMRIRQKVHVKRRKGGDQRRDEEDLKEDMR